MKVLVTKSWLDETVLCWPQLLAAADTVCCEQGKHSGSHFCVTLVIQPPAGTWDLGRGLPRICWAVPSGPEPATRPELRAANVLWIVGLGPAQLPSGKCTLCLPCPKQSVRVSCQIDLLCRSCLLFVCRLWCIFCAEVCCIH